MASNPKKPMLARLTPAGVALLYAAFAALWIVASGHLLALAVSDPLLHGRIEQVKGLAFVAVTGMLLYLLLKGWRESSGDAATVRAGDAVPPKATRLALVFVALALVVPLIGLAIVKIHIPQAEQDAYRNLESIAKLKAEQIGSWLGERNGDGEMLAVDDAFAVRIGQFVRQEQDAELSRIILSRFEHLLTHYHYTKILLLDTGGRLLLSSGEDVTTEPVLPGLLRRAATSKQVQRRDIYRDEEGHIHLEWAVPLVVPGAQGGRVVAVVVLRVTAQRFIFPLIQNWPTASASGETLLVRRDGESALFLNELRHRKEAPMTLMLPVSEPGLPAAIAIRANRPGTVRGKDYRGVEVLAAYRQVAGTDWHIVAKVDRDEVLKPMWDMVHWITLTAFAAVAAIMAALLLLWRQQQRAQRLALSAHSAAATEESERRFRAIAQSANEAIITADSSGSVVGWNPCAERLFGYTEAEMRGQSLTRLIPERFRERHCAGLARVVAGGERHVIGKTVELAGLREDGSEFPLELSLAQWETATGRFFTAIIHDITKRKANEAKIQRLTQLYAALSQCNQAIVRCANEEELFPQICRDAVQFGGFKMAWIGVLGEADQRVKPVASYGEGVGRLKNMQIPVDASSLFWCGLTGAPLHGNQPCWCQDFQNDPLAAPCHGYARYIDCPASASLPLLREGKQAGSLVLYSDTCDAFDEDVRKLLVEMAMDINFALDNFANEKKRTLAEQKVMESERHFHSLFENMLEGYAHCRMIFRDGVAEDFVYIDVNRAFGALTGLREVIGKKVSEVIPGIRESSPELFEIYGRVALTGQPEQFETYVGALGIWFSISVYCPEKEYFVAVFDNITERKRAEAEVLGLNAELEAKVIARTADLDNARLEAEQANRSKSDFLAAMSHEIRTPMNGVIGMLDVLQQSSLKSSQIEMVNVIHDSAFSLLTVINDILDFSKIEAGKLQIESIPMSVADVVEGACETMSRMASKKEVELTLFIDPVIPATVMGDPGRLRQILVNLANNAIKFSSGQQRRGKVSVRAILAESGLAGSTPEQVALEFRVTDNGIGMDEATRARLFTAFTQADSSTTRNYGGTGLGLVISRQLANIMGGGIAVQSEPGKGSIFSVRLPFNLLQDAGRDSSRQDNDVGMNPDLQGLPCLVVGGTESLADDSAAYLVHAGAEVERVADLGHVKEWIAGRPPGLCVVVIEAAAANLLPDELRAAARAYPEREARFVVIRRGLRREPRIEDAGMVLVDGNALTRRSLLKAVAIAAGRTEQPDWNGEPDNTEADGAKTRLMPVSREEARRLGSLILIAEDNEINQKVILQQLALLGKTADIADNGREALESWRSGDYGILLTDLHMPEMDGYDLTAAIRADEETHTNKPRIPIIAFTANALKGEADRCRAVGMDDYLSKPVQLADLKTMLEKWMPVVAGGTPDVGLALPADKKTCRAEPDLQPQPLSSLGGNPHTIPPEEEGGDGLNQADERSGVTSTLAPASLPVDVNVLKALVGDDEAMIREFLHDFRLGAEKITTELRVACASGQAADAGALAHKLKSSSRSVGALALGDLCAQIEQAGKSGDNETLAVLLPRFEVEMAAVNEHIGLSGK